MVVALFFGDTVASEASWGSLRYLLAIPVPRARLLGVKLVVALTLLAAGAGRCWSAPRCWPARCATAGTRCARTIADEIAAGDGAAAAARRSSATSRSPCWSWPALAFLLSVSTDAPLGAVGGAVLLQILSSILDQITALGAHPQLPADPLRHAWLGLLSTPMQTDDMVKGAIAAVVYAAIFFGLAFWRFLRKDVVS